MLDPKSAARSILIKLEPQGVENSQDLMTDKEDDQISVLKTISQNLLESVRANDPHAFAQAMCSFMEAYEQAEETEMEHQNFTY